MIACSAIMDELLDVHSNEYENRVDWAMALSLPYIIIRRVKRDAPDPLPTSLHFRLNMRQGRSNPTIALL